MRKLLGIVGFLALVQGVMGLVGRFTEVDWGVVNRLGFLDGYEVYASVALIALACALFAAAENPASD
ncbi:hypothetical protein [Streptomyces sp. NPDC003717]|uniref:hypothetical protein n=1 Tax=Streptomyces sp. NPDC003717 TaxID=3154276 RepID=UPI0033B81A84